MDQPQQSFCKAFFSGSIRDKTTKESRKAADSLAVIGKQCKHPGRKPLDHKVVGKLFDALSPLYLWLDTPVNSCRASQSTRTTLMWARLW